MFSVLIIGCGNIAGGFDVDRPVTSLPFTHAGAYCAQGDFRLLACVEPDHTRRVAFQQHWGVGQAFSSLEEVLNEGLSFDVVSICSPTVCHAADLRAVLALHPKLVFCEKPLTYNLAESEAIAEQYQRAGIPLMVNYTRRWDERVQTLADQIRQRHWGAVRSVSCVYNKGLYNNGSHMLDLLLQLLGPVSVIAAGPAVVDMWQDDPSIPAMLLAAQNIPITMNCAHAEDYSLFELELVAEQGTVKMLNGGLDWQIRHVESSQVFSGYRTLGAPVYQKGLLDHAALSAVNEIKAVIAEGCTPSCTADNAIVVQNLCEAIRSESPGL